jgi:Conjugative transposon protein TcpC
VVRRSSVAILASGTESAAYGGKPLLAVSSGTAVAKSPWNGCHDQCSLAWPMRVVLWASIVVIGYCGIMTIMLNEMPADTKSSGVATVSPSLFLIAFGEAYKVRFSQVCQNLRTANRAQLTTFILANVSSVQSQFSGCNVGTLHLHYACIAGIDVRSANTAVVTLLAAVNGHLMELGVPLYASGGKIVVSGQPATLPAPSTVTPPSAPQASTDSAVQSALSSQLPAFFQAYASGDQATLNRFLAPGVSITGLDGAVVYSSIAGIAVPAGGATRDITVTVDWTLPEQVRTGVPQLAQTYEMTVVDQQNGKWYVKETHGLRSRWDNPEHREA